MKRDGLGLLPAIKGQKREDESPQGASLWLTRRRVGASIPSTSPPWRGLSPPRLCPDGENTLGPAHIKEQKEEDETARRIPFLHPDSDLHQPKATPRPFNPHLRVIAPMPRHLHCRITMDENALIYIYRERDWERRGEIDPIPSEWIWNRIWWSCLSDSYNNLKICDQIFILLDLYLSYKYKFWMK